MNLIDWDLVHEFLEAIGRSEGNLVFAVYPPDPSKPCVHIQCDADNIPRAEIEATLAKKPSNSLGIVINPSRDQPSTWGTKPEHLNKIGKLRAWGASDLHIDRANAVFFECDGGLPRDAQEALPALAGLPEPSISVWTGGKSLHHYWVFTPGQEPDPGLFRDFQRRLATAVQQVAPEAGADTSISNPARVMRIPGGVHPSTGERSVIAHQSTETFTKDEIAQAAPAFFQRGDRPAAPSHHWFSQLPADRQEQLAIEMLRDHIPLRTEAGKGAYPVCFACLAAVTHHFGQAKALDIVLAANWRNPGTWEPESKIPTIDDSRYKASIGRLINTAIENGWQLPQDCSEAAEAEQSEPDQSPLVPFQFLGYDHGTFFYMPTATGQVIALSAVAHTKLNLISLAGSIRFWEQNFFEHGKETIDWDAAVEWMVVECQRKGVYDPDRIRGRGAWVDANRVIFHLGMRLMVDGIQHPVVGGMQSYYFYEHARPLDGPSDSPMADNTASAIYEIAKSFSWESQASAHFLMGWLALAPVCGALDWRPHIWVTGGKGTGKTTILRSFMRPLLGGIYQCATGGTTEAGLRGTLRSDAIPIVFDEFEQNEVRDKQNVQNVLSLARIASSEGGKVIKGTAGGGYNSYEIRSMFCVSSINVALVQGADQDRFCILALNNATDGGSDRWRNLEASIHQYCTTENGRDLIARTLTRIPTIRANARAFGTALAKHHGQRFGDQHGALLAGAFSMRPNSDRIIDADTAERYVAGIDWTSQRRDDSDADENKCLARILESLIQIEGGRRMTVLELITLCVNRALPTIEGSSDGADKILGRHGIAIKDGKLLVANNNNNLQALLRDTPWSGGAHRQALRRVAGAMSSTGAERFSGSGVSRATVLPVDVLGEL
jgi:putative DNA primase/helicase